MKVRTKQVYYCDHCKKHGLLRNMMERHEQRCTLNPARICNWGDKPHGVLIPALAEQIHEYADSFMVDWLHDVCNGCPACMLAVFRQSGINWHSLWTYDEEVQRFRDAERERIHEEQRQDDMRQLYA